MPGKLGEVIKVICGGVAIFIPRFPESLNSVVFWLWHKSIRNCSD